MTVAELIAELQKIENQDAVVEVYENHFWHPVVDVFANGDSVELWPY